MKTVDVECGHQLPINMGTSSPCPGSAIPRVRNSQDSRVKARFEARVRVWDPNPVTHTIHMDL